MNHVFVDTDIILDVLTDRKPFSREATALFSFIEEGKLKGYTTSLSFSNLYYVLRKYASHHKVISILEDLSDLLEILPVDETVVKAALRSKFRDYEDAIQCYSAQSNPNISAIITRNVKDYKTAELAVMAPDTLLSANQ